MEVDALLATAHALAGRYPDAIAVDMPLAFDPIVARRRSDAMISTLFGAAGAAVHSPNALRPGLIAGQFRVELEQRGYELRVTETKPPHPLALIETYPHPIAMWLCHSRYRLPYKSHNVGKYWPQLAAADRCRRLLAIWQDIVAAIEPRISGIELPAISQLHGASRGALKAVEDGIDALICAIAGISYVTGAANPIGDRASAIWLPVGCEDYASRPDRYAHFADHTPHQAGQYRRIGAIEHL
jgi:predicted RNase H-like nuclease